MTSDLLTSALPVLFLMIMSAFFSGAETGFTASSRARLTEIERRGSKRAQTVLKLSEAPERLIGSLLLGNNLVNITASAMATALLIKLFGDSGAVIASIVMTALILIFSEVLPKTYAIAYPERVALSAAPILKFLVSIFAPVVMAVEYIVKSTLRLFGVNIDDNASVLSAHDELRGAIALHHKEETLVKSDRDMLGGILDLKDLEVADIMVHRTKMMTLDGSQPVTQLIAEMLASPHTRMPVYRDNPDNIIGVMHAKTLFAALQNVGGDGSKLSIDDIMTPAWFVPDTRPLEDQLNAFLRRKLQLALVVDEYGEVQGLVTLEDILEEIVGDIKDEFDGVATGVRKARDGALVVDGTVPIRDLNRSFDWKLPDEEATTIAGLVIHEARMIPDAGQAFSFHGFRFEVLKKRKQQLTSIKVVPLVKPDEADLSG
jgi:Mg2+/Co2+ transporter CorB